MPPGGNPKEEPEGSVSGKRAAMAFSGESSKGISFYGEEGEDYPTWKAQTQMILMLMKDDEHMLYLIKNIKGKASQTLVAGGVIGLRTTEAIFDKLETRYGISIDKGMNLDKAKRCYQGVKTVETYSGEMSGYLTNSGLSILQQTDMYIAGLRRDLHAMVMSMSPTTMGEAIRMATRYEPLFPLSKTMGATARGRGGNIDSGDRPARDMTKVKCYKCNKMGHFKRDCRGEKAQGAETGGDPKVAETSGNVVAH